MVDQGHLPYRHVIVVTVGLSIIEKTLKRVNQDIYDRLMGSDRTEGEFARYGRDDISRVEQGEGSREQLELETRCFNENLSFGDLGKEILREKRNRYSAEVSSLYQVLKDKGIGPTDCRIVLVATDSAEGVFAARLNKRVMAQRLFACPPDIVQHWKNEADNTLHESLRRLPIICVPGLQVKDPARFERTGNSAFERLIKEEDTRVTAGAEKLLNVTGGFKGVVPVASGVAWRYYWDVVYLYEETSQLIYCRRPPWMLTSQGYDGLSVPLFSSIG